MTVGDGVSLADPTIPVDPEAVARALGTAIRHRHTEAADVVPLLTLATVADMVMGEAEPVFDTVLEDGPYLGRTVGELARLAVETVVALPPATAGDVALHPGVELDDCTLLPDGTITLPAAVVRGDRELDLASVAVAVGSRFGPAVVAPLFEAYGMDELDLRRLDTSQLLVSLAAALDVNLAALR